VTVKKQAFVQLHRLVRKAAENMVEREGVEDLEELFPVYEQIDVEPTDVHTNKSDQGTALRTLTAGLSDLVQNDFEPDEDFYRRIASRAELGDEELVRTAGEVYRDIGFSRQEAAELISEQTDFTYRTVYDKFTDHDISFTFHDDDTRERALEMLEEYADEGVRREDALEQVGEELDVPPGTLKNWLSQEGMTFTENVSAVVTDESREELMYFADHYFDFSDPEGVEAMEQALGRKRDTFREYAKGGIDTMPVELLERLDSLFESEPIYRMDDPERYVEDSTPKTVEVEDDFQEFLFRHMDGELFQDITGKSPTTFNRYRNNKSQRVDREAYRKVFQVVSHMYERHPEPEIESFVDRNSYATSSGDETHALLDPEEIEEELAFASMD
jgi:hypothetical protein